jgi:hypothetical protein
MTRPDFDASPGEPTPQWTPQPYSSQPFPSPAASPPASYQPYQSHPGYSYPPDGSGPPPTAVVPDAQQRRTKPFRGRLVLLSALAGLFVVALLGRGLLTAESATAPDPVEAAGTAADQGTPVVTMSLPPVIDGQPQIDNQYSREMVDSMRQEIQGFVPDAVIGLYGDPGQPPAFMVMAGSVPAASADPDLVISGFATGFQGSLGETVDFVDQPAGPLGGKMRCAEHPAMATCVWSVSGAFGVTMTFEQDLTTAAATALVVREAVETHSG